MSALFKLMQRLDTLTAEQKDDIEEFEPLDVFNADLGEYIPESLPSQTKSNAEIKNLKAASSRLKASLSWNTQWSFEKNVSQLLSNAMRMHADELELELRADGYVSANKLINVAERYFKNHMTVGALDEDKLKRIIVGSDAEDLKKATRSKWKTGMGERHQFIVEADTMFVRCMQGHLSSLYGDGVGLIDLKQIFNVLTKGVLTHAFHDTKKGNIDSISGAGLISNACGDGEGGMFVHLWVENDKRRKKQDVAYTVDVHAAMDGGIVFYQAANGVVLVEKCIPKQYLIKCDVHIDTRTIPGYIPFYDSDLNTDSLLMQFAQDVWKGCESSERMCLLWRVLWPTINQRMEGCSDTVKSAYCSGGWNSKGGVHNVKLHIKFSYDSSLGIYLLMINGKNDFNLIKLGKAYGFPRGCPVLWKPTEYVDLRGFFPKFDNDENEGGDAPAFKAAVLDGARSLYFFKKWSGFLLHVIAFKENERFYWTVCSKQSADPKTKYVIRGRDMMADLLTESLLRRLAENHLYLGGEAMHVDDEHGYVAKENAVVVTCVGKGTYWNKAQHPSDSVSVLMEYFSSADVVNFCSEFGLKCDSSYTLSADEETLKRSVLWLLKDRDLLRDSGFEQFISERSGFVKTNGTVDHMTLVGDVLEGFVFHVITLEGTKRTVKVKLPFYTWRTMFLRAWLDIVIGKESDSVEGKQFITKDCAFRIDAFVRRWCFTTDGKKLFQKLLKCAAVKLQTQWPSILSGNFGWAGGKVAGRVHVMIADTVEDLYFSDGGIDVIEKEAAEFDGILDAVVSGNRGPLDDVLSIETFPVTICICVGPVGAGKSTFMRRIFSSDPGKFEIVDGDMVVGRELPTERDARDLTLKLSSERNPTTLSRVWEAVMRGKVPLVSSGGGPFVTFGRGKDAPRVCKLKERVQQVFGVEANIVVILMRNSKGELGTENTILQSDKAESSALIDNLYNPKGEYMENVFKNRSSTGEWDAYNAERDKISFIAARSKESSANAHSVLAIIDVADTVFTAPFRPGGVAAWQASVTGSTGLDAVLRCLGTNLSRSGYFQQLRAVVVERVDPGEKVVCRHVTLDFNSSGFEFSSREIDYLVEKLQEMDFEGKRFLMRFRPDGAIAFDTSTLSETVDGDYERKPLREVDVYESCKTVSVVYAPVFSDFCKCAEKIPHITEEVSDFPAKDSVNVIKYFNSGSSGTLALTSRAKGKFVFDKPLDEQVFYEYVKGGGRTIGQRKVIVRGNYVAGTENVPFKCIGIAVFGNDDAC